MAVTIGNNAGATNVDSSVSSLIIPFVSTGVNQGIVVNVGVHSKTTVVLSVVDSVGNVYTKQQSGLAKFEEDYVVSEYDAPPAESITHHTIEGECWTTHATTGTTSTVTVTLTGPARFAVSVQGYIGCTAFGASSVATFASTSAPTISLVTTAANSYVSAGFASNSFLNQAATLGNLRGQATAGSSAADSAVEVAVADILVASSAGTGIITLGSTDTEEIDGDNLVGGNINATQLATPFPMSYVVCAVEIKA